MSTTITIKEIMETVNEIKSANVDEIMNEMRAELSNYDLTLDQYSAACREMEQVEREIMSVITDVMPEELASKFEGVFKSFREFMKNMWLDSVHHKASETTMAHYKYTIETAKEVADSAYTYYMQMA